MTRRSGRPRFSASHSGVAMSSGRAMPAKRGLRGGDGPGAGAVRMIRPVVSPFMPDPEKVAAIRTLLPATGAGIYLNAGTAGPMPAETQRAMDEQAAARAGRRPRELPTCSRRSCERMGGAAGVDRRGDRGRPRRHRDDPLHDRRHEPRRQRAAVARGRPRRDHPPRAPRRPRARCSRCASGSASRSSVVDIGDGGDDERPRSGVPQRPSSGRPARSSRATSCGPRARSCRSRRLGALARDGRRRVDHRRRPGGRRDPGRLESLDVDAYAIPGQKWLLGPEGMGALWARRALGGRRGARERRLHLVRVLRPAPAGAPPGRPPVRVTGSSIARPSSASPGAAAGSRCTSGCRGPTSAPRDSRPRARTAWPRSTACRSSRPRHAMGTLVTFRIARLAGRGRGPRARRPDVRDHPRPAADRRDPDLGRLLEHRGGAGALRAGRRAARRPHARVDPAPPHARGPRVATTRRCGDRRAHAARRAARGQAAGIRRGPLAPVPARAAARVPGGDDEPRRSRSSSGSLFLAYDIALDRGATLPGGDLRLLALTLYVAIVLDRGCGADVPRGAAAHRRRATAARRGRRGASRSGLFAAVPIAYLVLVVAARAGQAAHRLTGGRPATTGRSGQCDAPDRPIDTALHRAGMIRADQPPHPTLEDSRGQRRTPHGAAKAVRRTRVRTAGRALSSPPRSRSIRTTCRSRRT